MIFILCVFFGFSLSYFPENIIKMSHSASKIAKKKDIQITHQLPQVTKTEFLLTISSEQVMRIEEDIDRRILS